VLTIFYYVQFIFDDEIDLSVLLLTISDVSFILKR